MLFTQDLIPPDSPILTIRRRLRHAIYKAIPAGEERVEWLVARRRIVDERTVRDIPPEVLAARQSRRRLIVALNCEGEVLCENHQGRPVFKAVRLQE